MFEYHYDILEKIADSLELAMKIQDKSKIKDSPIQKYVSNASSIEEVLKNIDLIDKLNKNLVDRISKAVEDEISQYREAIVALDYIPEVRQYIRDGNVMDNTGFGTNGITPRMVLNNVTEAWKNYKNGGYLKKDLDHLNDCLNNLYEMNRHLAYFLREMLYDNNPDGDYEFIIDRF
ncbi:hypothetical protein [Bacillus sp. V2I10]|uniref:hypothetical protein n=1 Tax=Bacillus sp. V2I10 TaxID=3042276 RepID=UPI0027831755|nr:hypothetical protein [Bacillus sp. V2I10]MDQ0862154.1 hypothetical protein [Bacillus sp. V2I10]